MAQMKQAKERPNSFTLAAELKLPVRTPAQLKRHLRICATVGKPVLVMGRPGGGKTEIIGQVSEELKRYMYVERFNGKDPTDLGLPYLIEDVAGFRRHNWSLPYWFRSGFEELNPDFPGGWTFFGDEFAQALPSVQNRVGELLNEKQLNGVPMHPAMWMVLAANFPQDKAATYPIPKQILNRCSVVVLVPSEDDFVDYCSRHDIRPEIMAFAKWRKECLDSYDADSMINCTARSLCALSPIMNEHPAQSDELDLYSSIIGQGWAAEFVGFLRTYRSLAKLEDILKDPKGTPIPDDEDPDKCCAVAAMIGRAMNKKNAGPLITYAMRLPMEYSTFAIRDAWIRTGGEKGELANNCKPMTEWCTNHGDVLA